MANLTYAELVTPERVLYSGEAEAVILRADGGDTTFLANHADYIASVDICVVRIQAARGAGAPADGVAPAEDAAAAVGGPHGGAGSESGAGESTSLGEVRAAVHGGFVKVADNRVTIVAGVAELADEIDVERARRALEAAEAVATEEASVPAAGSADTEEASPAPRADSAQTAAARARVRLEAAQASAAEVSHA